MFVHYRMVLSWLVWKPWNKWPPSFNNIPNPHYLLDDDQNLPFDLRNLLLDFTLYLDLHNLLFDSSPLLNLLFDLLLDSTLHLDLHNLLFDLHNLLLFDLNNYESPYFTRHNQNTSHAPLWQPLSPLPTPPAPPGHLTFSLIALKDVKKGRHTHTPTPSSAALPPRHLSHLFRQFN